MTPAAGDEARSTPKPRKRPPGTGTVRQLPSGKWNARLPASLGQIAVPGSPFATRTQAVRELDREIARIEAGISKVVTRAERASTPTVVEAAAKFLTDNETRMAGSTVASWKTALKRLNAEPYREIATKRVTEAKSSDMTALRKAMDAQGVGYHSARHVLALISTTYGSLIEDDVVDSNPVKGAPRRVGVKRRVTEEEGEDRPVPTWEHMHRLIVRMWEPADRIQTLISLWSGPRFAETAALDRLTGLSQTRPQIEIKRVIVYRTADGRSDKDVYGNVIPAGQRAWTTEPPKTGRRRTAPLPTQLWEAALEYQATVPEAVKPQWDVLFPNRTETGKSRRGGSGVWTPTQWKWLVWDRVQDGVNPYTDPHLDSYDPDSDRIVWVKDLRAAAGSNLWAGGASEAEAQRLLGHRTAATTIRHYLRWAEDAQEHPERVEIRNTSRLTIQERLDALWDVFVDEFGNPLEAPYPEQPPVREKVQHREERRLREGQQVTHRRPAQGRS